MSKSHVTIPVFIPHMGCPHTCIFCNQWETSSSITEANYNYVINKIENYLSTINENIKKVEVAFFGGSFTGIPVDIQSELLNAANFFYQKKLIDGIRLSTRPDYIDDKVLKFLKKNNVDTIELGIQSFSDEVLSFSERGHTRDNSLKAIKLVKKYEFNLIIQLMPGLPFDTKERSIESAKITADLKPAGVRIYPAVVLNKTKMADLYTERKYQPLELHEAVDWCSEMYKIFIKKNIPVIRLGLHPFSEDEVDNILAGPYHPSFGFFVKSRIKRDELEELLSKNTFINSSEKKSVTLYLPEKNIEEYIGYRKDNISYLKNKFAIDTIKHNIHRSDKIIVEASH